MIHERAGLAGSIPAPLTRPRGPLAAQQAYWRGRWKNIKVSCFAMAWAWSRSQVEAIVFLSDCAVSYKDTRRGRSLRDATVSAARQTPCVLGSAQVPMGTPLYYRPIVEQPVTPHKSEARECCGVGEDTEPC